jgi:ataxin-3
MENPVAASMARNQAMLERMRREQEAALREHYHEESSHFHDPSSGVYPRRHVEDEEEQLRRAIAESEAMAREQGETQPDSGATGTRATLDDTEAGGRVQDNRTHGGRVYDDEDADFQAALQASLETAPQGAHTSSPTTMQPRSSPARRSPHATRSMASPSTRSSVREDEDEDDGSYSDDDEDDTATEDTLSDGDRPEQAEAVDIDEMRRRRLARFSGS